MRSPPWSNMDLWHERESSLSSVVERVIMPDSTFLAD
jgi:adenylosuccinate lyase